MKKNKTAISTCLSIFDGTVTRIMSRGLSKDKKKFYCFLEVKGKDADFVTDAAYEFRTRLENTDLYGEFLGTRKMIHEDNFSGFREHMETRYEVAMLMIYVDRRDIPLAKRLYKQ